VIALFLAPGAVLGQRAGIKKFENTSMINGIWKIETAEPPAGARLSGSFLPNGTLIELLVKGPSRHAIEESRHDELGGQLIVLPNPPAAICKSGLASDLCTGDALDSPASPVSFDAIFTFYQWTAKDAGEVRNTAFADLGAKPGSRFVLITIKDPGVDFELWMKSKDEFMAQHIVTPAPRKSQAVSETWRKRDTASDLRSK
jgi:hypothetical protein